MPGVDLYQALNANNRFFTRFGGHAYAAGVTMPEKDFEEFRQALDGTFRSTVDQELFIPRRSYEAEIELSELTLPMVEELELLARWEAIRSRYSGRMACCCGDSGA